MSGYRQVIEVYKGVRIRRYNYLRMLFGVAEYKKLIDVAEDTGLSIKKILAYSGQPCEKCKNIEVVVFDKNNNPHRIKRGILSVPQNSGTCIFDKNKDNNEKGNRSGKKNKKRN